MWILYALLSALFAAQILRERDHHWLLRAHGLIVGPFEDFYCSLLGFFFELCLFYPRQHKGLLFSLDYTNQEYAFSWVLGFGDKAEVLAPEETRAEFAALARNISEQYEERGE